MTIKNKQFPFNVCVFFNNEIYITCFLSYAVVGVFFYDIFSQICVVFVLFCNGQLDRKQPPQDLTMDQIMSRMLGGYDGTYVI